MVVEVRVMVTVVEVVEVVVVRVVEVVEVMVVRVVEVVEVVVPRILTGELHWNLAGTHPRDWQLSPLVKGLEAWLVKPPFDRGCTFAKKTFCKRSARPTNQWAAEKSTGPSS